MKTLLYSDMLVLQSDFWGKLMQIQSQDQCPLHTNAPSCPMAHRKDIIFFGLCDLSYLVFFLQLILQGKNEIKQKSAIIRIKNPPLPSFHEKSKIQNAPPFVTPYNFSTLL